MAFLLSLLIFILFVNLYFKRKIFLLSPVDVFIFFFLFSIIISVVYHYYYPTKEKINFYNFDQINDRKLYNTTLVFLRMILFFVFGVYLYSKIKLGYTKLSRTKIELVFNKKINIDPFKLVVILIFLVTISTFLVFYDFGLEIFRRAKYIPKDKVAFKFVYQNLFILVSIVAGIAYKKSKLISIIALLISLILSLSIGSRYATLYLIAFGVAYSLSLNNQKRKFFYVFFIPLVFFFFGLNLSLRSRASGHGLIPYFEALINRPDVIWDYSVENFYYTFLYGFFATADTITQYKNATTENLITCLSPLFGFMTRWPMIASTMRSNIWAPFTSIGEMSKFPVFSIFYYMFIGYYFTFIDNFIKKEILQKKYFFAIVQFLLLMLFIIFSFEYNLRSSNRFIYYSILFYLLGKFLKVIQKYFYAANSKKNSL